MQTKNARRLFIRTTASEGGQPPAKEPIRVLLIDDHPVVRARLRTLIDSRRSILVVGEAGGGADGIASAAREQPHIVLLDSIVHGESAIDYIPRLLLVSKQSRVLIFTSLVSAKIDSEAAALGATCLILRNHTPQTLVTAIRNAHFR